MDISFFEFLTWKIAPIVGGRLEALKTPIIEALGYILMENEKQKAIKQKEQSEIYVAHMSRRIVMEMSKANEKNINDISKKLQDFEEMIRPKDDQEPETKQAADFKWDNELMKKWSESQEKGVLGSGNH